MSLKKQEAKALRKQFRESVFARDGHKCVFCPKTENLDAHHITDRHEMPNDGYAIENGITLCPLHHEFAEYWHRTKKTKFVDHFLPDQLYKKIGSSYEKAHQACIALKTE